MKGAIRGPGKFGLGGHFDADKATQAVWIDDHKELNVTKQLSIFAWVKWNKGGIKHVDPLWWPMIVMKASVNKTYLLLLDTGDGVNPNKPSIAFRMSGPGTVYSKETVKKKSGITRLAPMMTKQRLTFLFAPLNIAIPDAPMVKRNSTIITRIRMNGLT